MLRAGTDSLRDSEFIPSLLSALAPAPRGAGPGSMFWDLPGIYPEGEPAPNPGVPSSSCR